MGLELGAMDRSIARDRRRFERMKAKLIARLEQRLVDATADEMTGDELLRLSPASEIEHAVLMRDESAAIAGRLRLALKAVR